MKQEVRAQEVRATCKTRSTYLLSFAWASCSGYAVKQVLFLRTHASYQEGGERGCGRWVLWLRRAGRSPEDTERVCM